MTDPHRHDASRHEPPKPPVSDYKYPPPLEEVMGWGPVRAEPPGLTADGKYPPPPEEIMGWPPEPQDQPPGGKYRPPREE